MLIILCAVTIILTMELTLAKAEKKRIADQAKRDREHFERVRKEINAFLEELKRNVR